MSRFIVALVVAWLLVPSLAQAAAPELSTTDRLKDRRYVAAGDRARVLGFEDGRFYANGWHITGEMGGIWTPPLKLVDGVWCGVDDEWVGPASKFTSGWGYTRFDFPDAAGLKVQRTDFAPDGRRAGLLGLKLTNPAGATRTVTVKVDAHSELMTEYPVGVRRRHAERQRQHRGHRLVRRPRLGLQGRRRPARRARAPLRRAGGIDPGPGWRRDRRRALRTAARARLHRDGDPRPDAQRVR